MWKRPTVLLEFIAAFVKFLGVVHCWDMREEKLQIKQQMEMEMEMEEGRTSVCEQQDEHYG